MAGSGGKFDESETLRHLRCLVFFDGHFVEVPRGVVCHAEGHPGPELIGVGRREEVRVLGGFRRIDRRSIAFLADKHTVNYQRKSDKDRYQTDDPHAASASATTICKAAV